jgi:hypothetical protein
MKQAVRNVAERPLPFERRCGSLAPIGLDILVRIMAQRLHDLLGQPVL